MAWPPERPAAVQGAPAFGAAKRTLDAVPDSPTISWESEGNQLPLVRFPQASRFPQNPLPRSIFRHSRPASIRTRREPRGARCMLGSVNTGGCCHLINELRHLCLHRRRAPPRQRSHPYSAIRSIPRCDSGESKSAPKNKAHGLASSHLHNLSRPTFWWLLSLPQPKR